MNLERYFEQIELYLEGRLQETEKEKFEQEMKTNPELKKAFDLYHLTLEAMDVAVEDDLRRTLTTWQEKEGRMSEPSSAQAKIVRMRPMRFVLAAAALLVLLLGAGLFWANLKYSNQALTADAYEAPTANGVRSAATDGPLHQGWELFQKGDYQAAAVFFENIPSENPAYAEARFLLGHSFFKLEKYEEAQAAFESAAAANDPRLKDKAGWGALLSCLSAKTSVDDCRVPLQKITGDPGHSFHARAISLQRKLDSPLRVLVW